MRVRAIGFAILGCSLPVQAVAQPGPGATSTVVHSPNVTGQLQLIVTCPGQILITPVGLPDGWSQKVATSVFFPFFSRPGMTTSTGLFNFPKMICTYGLGSDMVDIQASPTSGFPSCKVDPSSNNKYICDASPAMQQFIKTFPTP